MRRVLVLVAVLLGAVVLIASTFIGASESGEVVVVRTTDPEGADQETRLWVIEHDGDIWLRAGDPSSSWLANLRRRPEIEVTRSGTTRGYTAVPTPEATEMINPLLREKYGLADSWIDFWFGVDDATAIRLVPRG